MNETDRLSVPIEDLEISIRTANFLAAAGYKTVGDIIELGANLKSTYGIGDKTLDEINAALVSYHAALGD